MNKITTAIILALAAMGAQANSISYSASTTRTLTDWGTDLGLAPVDLSVAQFDGSLGTLNSVIITLTNNTDVRFGFYNASGSSYTFNTGSSAPNRASVESSIWVNGLGALSGQMLVVAGGSMSTPGLDGLTVAAGATYDSGLISFSNTNSSSYTDAATLSIFTGGSSISFSTNSMANALYTGGSSVQFSPQSWAQAGLTVTYDYTARAVPEPSMVALAGVAALGLLASRRRNRV